MPYNTIPKEYHIQTDAAMAVRNEATLLLTYLSTYPSTYLPACLPIIRLKKNRLAKREKCRKSAIKESGSTAM